MTITYSEGLFICFIVIPTHRGRGYTDFIPLQPQIGKQLVRVINIENVWRDIEEHFEYVKVAQFNEEIKDLCVQLNIK